MSYKPLPPLVSVIVPVRNEQSFVKRALDSLLVQDYPPERMEIIVVDGISSDNTWEIVEQAARQDSRIRLLRNPARIMAKGFNAGLSTARGDVVVMMGGHAELAPDYVSTCCSILAMGIADCVGGPITTVCETESAEAISLAVSSRFGVGGVAFRLGCNRQKYVDTVAFGAYTRSIIEKAGPLDEEFVRGQDDEFNYRIRKIGGRILIAPEIRSRYVSRSSVGYLWRQYFQYGYWKVRIFQKHPRQMQPRHFAPAAFVASLVSALLLAAAHPALGRGVLLLGGTYLVSVSVVSTALVLRQKKWRLAPCLAITFPVLHFSYGIGFLAGLARFWKLWWKPRNSSLIPHTQAKNKLINP